MEPFTRHPRRELVDLLPRSLSRRPRGWGGIPPLLGEARLARPQAALLRAIVIESDPAARMPEAELRDSLFNPYASVHPFIELLPGLVERGYLEQAGESYAATSAGRGLIW